MATESPLLSLRVIIAPGEQVLNFTNLSPSLTLFQFRGLISTQLSTESAIRVPSARIIYSGRVLSNDSSTLFSLNIQPESTLHLVFASGPGGSGGNAPPEHEIHGDSPRGFDRLLSLGLDSEGISVLRSLFLSDVLSQMGPILPRMPNESEAARVLRMEVSGLLLFASPRERAGPAGGSSNIF